MQEVRRDIEEAAIRLADLQNTQPTSTTKVHWYQPDDDEEDENEDGENIRPILPEPIAPEFKNSQANNRQKDMVPQSILTHEKSCQDKSVPSEYVNNKLNQLQNVSGNTETTTNELNQGQNLPGQTEATTNKLNQLQNMSAQTESTANKLNHQNRYVLWCVQAQRS